MIQFYKPNPKVTGSACSFWLNKDRSIMSSIIKQDSWNEKTRTGSFVKNKDNPKGKVVLKLGRIEVAGIIDSLETNREFCVYHKSEKQSLQVRFGPYIDKTTQAQKGFSFAVTKNDNQDSTIKIGFIIGFTFPEARLLKHDLSIFLAESLVSNPADSRQEQQEEDRPPQQKILPKEVVPASSSDLDDSW